MLGCFIPAYNERMPTPKRCETSAIEWPRSVIYLIASVLKSSGNLDWPRIVTLPHFKGGKVSTNLGAIQPARQNRLRLKVFLFSTLRRRLPMYVSSITECAVSSFQSGCTTSQFIGRRLRETYLSNGTKMKFSKQLIGALYLRLVSGAPLFKSVNVAFSAENHMLH